MHYSFLSALALGFAASALATISSPAVGAQWPVNQGQTISWDTTGLTAPLNIHLVPAGAKDTTVIITEIALQVENTGSFMWSPPATITVADVEIIIIDAKQVLIISEVFVIIIIDKTTTSTKKLTTPTLTSTKVSTVTKLQTLATTSSSIKISTTTINSVLLATTTIKTSSLTLAAIQMPTSTVKVLTTSTKPLTTMPTSSMKLSTMAMVTTSKALNSTMLKSTATAAVSAAKVTFTGDASRAGFSNAYSVVSGGLVALLAMMFL